MVSLNAHLVTIMFNAGYCLLAFATADAVLVHPRRLLRTAAGMLGPFISGAAVGVVLIALIFRLFGLSVGGALSHQVRDIGGLLGNWQYPGWTRETLAFGLMALANTCPDRPGAALYVCAIRRSGRGSYSTRTTGGSAAGGSGSNRLRPRRAGGGHRSEGLRTGGESACVPSVRTHPSRCTRLRTAASEQPSSLAMARPLSPCA